MCLPRCSEMLFQIAASNSVALLVARSYVTEVLTQAGCKRKTAASGARPCPFGS